MSNKTLWGGRFEDSAAGAAGSPGGPTAQLQAFGASLAVDRRMWREDIAGSVAHAKMLAACGIITNADARAITCGLEAIAQDIEAGNFDFKNADEDIHMSIERVLTERIGAPGAKLHTARSRNDQVATDTRLYIKRSTESLAQGLCELRTVLLELAAKHTKTIMPGYTHLQKAQPVLFAHHLLAYFWMLTRDHKRMLAARDAADASPLGAAALAGTGHAIDRAMTAKELGFATVIPNSMDAVSDRDYLLDCAYACSVTMLHLSRLCEEIILWSSNEFGFVTLSNAYSTGSSIMPQKKNPDYAELVRGKTGRVAGDLLALMMVLKGLPLAYNKDLQEDKEGVFDAIDTLSMSLEAIGGMLATMQVNTSVMLAAAKGGFSNATDLADFLVTCGLPFREAHEVVGKLVLACEKQGKPLEELTDAELVQASTLFGGSALSQVREALKIESVVGRRQSEGGTAYEQVEKQLELAREALGF